MTYFGQTKIAINNVKTLKLFTIKVENKAFQPIIQ